MFPTFQNLSKSQRETVNGPTGVVGDSVLEVAELVNRSEDARATEIAVSATRSTFKCAQTALAVS